MAKINLFVLRHGNHYGIGVSPVGAMSEIVNAGLDKRLAKKGVMLMLPEGTTDITINEVDGALSYGPIKEKAKKLIFDLSEGKFVQPEVEHVDSAT